MIAVSKTLLDRWMPGAEVLTATGDMLEHLLRAPNDPQTFRRYGETDAAYRARRLRELANDKGE